MDLEELIIDDSVEFELIEKMYKSHLEIPLVTVGSVLYFNSAATPIVPKFIKWFVSSDYVIGLPTEKDDENAYIVRSLSHKHCEGKTAFFPAQLRNMKKIKKGIYQIYKYKNGLAFKRYEQFDFDSIK